MAQREGSVFVYLFVTTLVLVVALVATVLILKTEKDERTVDVTRLALELDQEKARFSDRTKDLTDLRKLVSGSDDNWPGNEFFLRELAQTEEKMNDHRKKLEMSGVSYANLLAPYKDYADVLTAMHNAWDEQTLKARKALENHDTVLATSGEQLKTRDDENSKLQDSLSDCERRYEENDSGLRQQIEDLTNQLAERSDEIIRKELDYKKQIAFQENRVQQLRNRVERCEAEKVTRDTIEDIEPDGRILEVEARSRVVWVSLGRKHHLRPGLVFKVFQYVGGKKKWKGEIEIRRVDEDFSEARILDQIDDLNPFTANDHVASPFYDPNLPPTFVFAGDGVINDNVSLETIKRKLSSYGAKVGDEVKIDTDFLVALSNYESTTEYRIARELGVTILREVDVLDYMGY